MRTNKSLLTCVSLLALGAASALSATTTAVAADRDETTVETLVITAERREENLQTAAISATVLNTEMLEAKGVTGLTALQFAAPGIQISDYSSANTFNIRGIGQSQVDIDLPSGVVIYRDGVPTLTGYFQNAPWYDMAGVEVLRGPQGTFVGKSAAAGAVFIRTRDPELGHLGGEATLGIGNHSFYEGTFVLNAPLSDSVAVRISFHQEFRNSLFDSISSNPLPGGTGAAAAFQGDDDRRLTSARLGVLWKPNDNFRAVWKTDFDYLHFGSHATSGFDPATGLEEDMNNIIVNGPHVYIDKGVRSSLNMNYTFNSGIRLNSLTGFQRVKTRADWDVNGSNPAPFWFRSGGVFTNYSQELNLISPDDRRLRWVTGLFWQKYVNDIPDWPEVGFDFFTNPLGDAFPFVALLQSPWQKNELNYAIFGQIAYDITDRLAIQLGGRYGHYEFDQFTKFGLFAGVTFPPPLFAPVYTPDFDGLPFGEPSTASGELLGAKLNYDENEFDWKANLNYEINDDHFIYGLVSRGHSPGSINIFPNFINPPTFASPPPSHTSYPPMTVINYEAGWKGTFAEGQVRTQLAAYYQTFKNYQANFARPASLGIPQIDTIGEFKAAQTTSKIWGIEAGLQAHFGDFEFDAALAYSKSKLGSFGVVVNPYFPLFDDGGGNPDPSSPYFGLYGTDDTVLMDGARTPFAPEFTANVGAAYTFHLTEGERGITMTPRFDVAYKSHSYAQLFANPSTRLPAVTLLNASVRFESGPWWASIWGTNLTDERFPGAKQNVGVDPANAFFPGPHIVGIVYRAPPRLFGVRVGRTW